MININISTFYQDGGARDTLNCDMLVRLKRDERSGRPSGKPVVGYFDFTVQEARRIAFALLAKAEEIDDERYERSI